MRQKHDFGPVWNEESRILILGSFPSVKSREQGFYYGHPQNRFWRLLASLLREGQPQSIEEKKQFLLQHKIAVWDVIESCEIVGSSDSSIRNVEVNDFSDILEKSQIRHIFANGNKAFELYERYAKPQTEREAKRLPSTSPANAAYSLEKLMEKWTCILEDL